MRKLILLLVLSCVARAFAEPALVLLPSGNLKSLPAVTVLRELRGEVIAAAELPALDAAGIAYTVLDRQYAPGHYVFAKPGREAALGGTVLYEDEGALLVRLSAPPRERQGGQSPLEKITQPARESRPPSTLDDPALDAWLTTLAAQVSADSIFSYVTTLASYNRYTRWTSNDQAAYWIRDKLISFGYDSVYLHAFTAQGATWSRQAFNVIAVLPGTAVPDSIVMIGGHMDATSENVSAGAPGADDNASGTAGMLEAARLLAGQPFRHTLMFVAFNGEEQGLQGSEAFAAQLAAQGRRLIGLLNMDMIGYYEAGGADLWIEGFYSGVNSIWLANAVFDNCEQFSTLSPYLYPQNGFGSDHESFHDAGFTAVLSIEYEYDSYACYHRLCDLPAQLNQPFMRQIAMVNIVTGAELAGPIGSGAISGYVTLAGSSDASGVLVRVLGGTQSETTAADGYYQLSGLLPGTYGLIFSHPGWRSDTLTGLVVTDGELPNQNITLEALTPATVSGTLTVVGGGDVSAAIVYVDETAVYPAAAGAFVLNPVYPGQRVITAALDGHALASQVITLSEGQHAQNIALTLYPLWDLEASNYGLDNQGTGWGWGTDTQTGAHSGSRVWGTVLNGNYANCTDYRLEMPAVCLAHLDSARLNIWHWYDIEPNGPTVDYDGANVSVAPFGSDVWQVIEPDGGYPGGAGYNCNPIQNQPAYAGAGTTWRVASFNLSAFTGQTLRVRFRLGTDAGVTRRGWYLDDIALLGWHSFAPETPAAVTDLAALSTPTGISLRWSASAGAQRYRIYRGTTFGQSIESMTLLATQTATNYVDTSANGITTAFYVVIAEN